MVLLMSLYLDATLRVGGIEQKEEEEARVILQQNINQEGIHVKFLAESCFVFKLCL